MSQSINLDKHEMVVDREDYENLITSNTELLEALKDIQKLLEAQGQEFPLPEITSICKEAITKAEAI